MTESFMGSDASGPILIDAYINLPPEPNRDPSSVDPNLARWFRGSKALLYGESLEDMAATIGATGITAASLNLATGQVSNSPYGVGQHDSEAIFESQVRRATSLVDHHPGRFQISVGLDPTGVMGSVRLLERAFSDHSAKSCWAMPSLVGLPPNHAVYFPIYAKCVELGIPIKLNVGLPGPRRFAEPQKPMHLDEVCLAFPELNVIATHVGQPWQVEMVSLLQKHPNLYLITSGFAPSRVPAEIWAFANHRGSHKIMWASDYPALPIDRCVKEARELPLKDNVMEQYLGLNAAAVFGFPVG